jgi:flagellar biosynthesis GTPase FlhF
MQLHTFSARSLAEALRLVREELGPDASVLQTREVGSTLSRWLGGRTIEVTASAELVAPIRTTKPVSIKRFPAAELQVAAPRSWQALRGPASDRRQASGGFSSLARNWRAILNATPIASATACDTLSPPICPFVGRFG